MRWFVGFFGMICAFAVIGMAGKYGYGDGGSEGLYWAFIYGAITFAGIFDIPVSIYIWKQGYRFFSGVFFVASSAVLVVALSNTFGAMATRANALQATRQHLAETVRTDRAALARKADERRAMVFRQTGETAVSAARNAAEAATVAKTRECDIQGTNCRKKQDAEQAALKALAEASRDFETTVAAKKLDEEIEKLTEKLENAAPVLEADAQSMGLARFLFLSEEKAATLSAYQKVGMSLVFDLVVTLWLTAFSVLSPSRAHACPASNTSSEYLEMMRTGEPETKRLTAPTAAQTKRDFAALDKTETGEAAETATNVEALTSRQPKQRTRKPLVSRQKVSGKPRKSGVAASVDVGDVRLWFGEQVVRNAEGKVRCGLVRASYERWCERHEKAPVSSRVFGETLKGELGVGFENVSNRASYLGIALRPALAVVSG